MHRLEKLAEKAGIEMLQVAADISGVSGRTMLQALIAGAVDEPTVRITLLSSPFTAPGS